MNSAQIEFEDGERHRLAVRIPKGLSMIVGIGIWKLTFKRVLDEAGYAYTEHELCPAGHCSSRSQAETATELIPVVERAEIGLPQLTCESVPLPGGVRAIVCGPRRRRRNAHAVDPPTSNAIGASPTEKAGHATRRFAIVARPRQAPGKDICPAHKPASRRGSGTASPSDERAWSPANRSGRSARTR
jgi:hypothetical protein